MLHGPFRNKKQAIEFLSRCEIDEDEVTRRDGLIGVGYATVWAARNEKSRAIVDWR